MPSKPPPKHHKHKWKVVRTETKGKAKYVFYICTICGEPYMEVNRSNL